MLKEKTLGWVFDTVYVPGKELGGTDALSRYGVRHEDCQPVSARKHLVGLLASEDLEDENDLEDKIHSIGTASGRTSTYHRA